VDADEENTSPRSRGLHEQAQTRIESVPMGAKLRGARSKSSDDEATVLHSMSMHVSTPDEAPARSVVRTPEGTRVLDPAVLAGHAARKPAEREPQGNYEPTRVIGHDEIGGRERSEGISLLAAQARGDAEPAETVVTRPSRQESPSDDDATRVGAMADLLAAGRRKTKGARVEETAVAPQRPRYAGVESASVPPSAVPTEAHRPYRSSVPPSAVPTGAHPRVPLAAAPTGGLAPPPSAVPTGGYPTVPSAGNPTGGHASVPAASAPPSRAAGRAQSRNRGLVARSGVLAPTDSAHEENRRLAWGFFIGILIAIAFMAAVFAIARVLMG